MPKGLAIVGILGAFAATLTILNVLQGAAVFIVLPILVAGSIVLVAQRSMGGAIAGLIVLALAVMAALGLAGSVTTESGSTDFGFSVDAGRLLALAGCLSIPLAAIALHWNDLDPVWLAYLGAACAVAAFLLTIILAEPSGDQTKPLTIIIALLPLGAIATMVGLWRSAPDVDHAAKPAGRAP